MNSTLEHVTSFEPPRAGASGEMRKRPGNLVRRAHQLHGALWASMVSRDVTPTQFAVLSAIAENPGTDQIAVSRDASLDTSTAASVVYRLINRGWVRVDRDDTDRRRNVLTLTDDGASTFAMLSHAASVLSDRFVDPLESAERVEFTRLLEKILDAT